MRYATHDPSQHLISILRDLDDLKFDEIHGGSLSMNEGFGVAASTGAEPWSGDFSAMEGPSWSFVVVDMVVEREMCYRGQHADVYEPVSLIVFPPAAIALSLVGTHITHWT